MSSTEAIITAFALAIKWTLLKISLCQQTGKRANGIDVNLFVKLAPRPGIIKATSQ